MVFLLEKKKTGQFSHNSVIAEIQRVATLKMSDIHCCLGFLQAA